ncbi:hypothetical protein NP493_1097g00024 [Ridgeia piscesae]|uniref:Uncharacterized protein n=1 Tax=Ridgeia piscesae TaxID=27915 RepID=A0AAD9KH41_RIDPI|nr:hypothetical protein NP493_1097g00024 [Ridgeia piscesae]
MHGDQTLARDTFKRCDYAKKFCISGDMKIPRMQVYNSQFTSMQITTNGYVTLGASYISRTPNMFVDMFSPAKKADIYKSGFAMFAPMWTDCNAKEGNVFYHVYDGFPRRGCLTSPRRGQDTPGRRRRRT